MKSKFYKPLGLLFLGLAALGVLLPVLPSTPFVLLAAWFFARSSEKWHRRLLDSELFGPMLRHWETERCLTRRTKITALTAMLGAGTITVLFGVDDMRLKIAAAVFMTIGAVTILSLKTCRCED